MVGKHLKLLKHLGNQYAKGTWWQAFNAVTFNTDHQQGSTNDGRLTSAWYGRNRRVKLKALDTALQMAENLELLTL